MISRKLYEKGHLLLGGCCRSVCEEWGETGEVAGVGGEVGSSGIRPGGLLGIGAVPLR